MTVARYTPFETDAVLRDDRTWLAVALVVAVLVYFVYLATHRYPAYGAGLYMQIAEQLRVHGYGLPARIPGYTARGVPFAYPPLAFYAAAAAVDLTGASAFTYSRLVPGLVIVASVVPYYFLARELLGTAPRAGFATVVFATAPEALQWHLSAGGIVRAPALLLALIGAWVGIQLFRAGDRRWTGPAAALFGLTILTHPVYAIFFGVTYLVLFAGYDRTAGGLVAGGLVAVGGLLLAAPWWSQVVAVHGVDVFAGAAGTHRGLGGGLARLVAVLGVEPDLSALFYLAVFAGLAYGLVRRRYVLVAWFLACWYVVGQARFLFVVGGLLVAPLVFEGVAPAVRRRAGVGWVVPVVAAIGLVLATTGLLYAGGALAGPRGSAQPAFVDDDDVAAMAWVQANTPPDAQFVVLGDAAEWFPQQTDRTILVGPWGVEWTTPARYERQLSLFRSLSGCHTESCLTAGLRTAGVAPDYVYVPTGSYTVRGASATQPPAMRRSLVASDRYDLVYENDGVAVFRTTRTAGRTRLSRRSGSRRERFPPRLRS
ncbi:MAG: hypothetical protein ABEJ23_08965 [Haloarculaceae archaeon]